VSRDVVQWIRGEVFTIATCDVEFCSSPSGDDDEYIGVFVVS